MPPERYGRRFRIAYIMETLARQANDFEGRVAIKHKDLSQPASFLILAELYKEAGQDEQALSWAERRNRIISWPACPPAARISDHRIRIPWLDRKSR